MYLTFFLLQNLNILPCHLYHRPTLSLHHTMRPIEIGPRAETTQGLNDSLLRLNRPTPNSKPKRPGLTNPGPKRPIFCEQVASFFSLYPILWHLHKQRLSTSSSILEEHIKVALEPRRLQSITGEPEVQLPEPVKLTYHQTIEPILEA